MAFRMSGWIKPLNGYSGESGEKALRRLGVDVIRYDSATGKFSVTMTDEVWVMVQTCEEKDLVQNRYLYYVKGSSR